MGLMRTQYCILVLLAAEAFCLCRDRIEAFAAESACRRCLCLGRNPLKLRVMSMARKCGDIRKPINKLTRTTVYIALGIGVKLYFGSDVQHADVVIEKTLGQTLPRGLFQLNPSQYYMNRSIRIGVFQRIELERPDQTAQPAF